MIKKPFLIRLEIGIVQRVKEFAARHGMKPTAAARYIFLFGFKTLEETLIRNEQLDRIEEKLDSLLKGNNHDC